MIAKMKIFAVGNSHACDSNHPRMLFVLAGSKSGKSLSWVDTSLSLAETVMTGGAGGGMMSGGCV